MMKCSYSKTSRSIAATFVVLTLFLVGCSKHEAPKAAAINVTVSPPAKLQIAEYLTFDGTVSASQNVDLVARVPGYLEKILFKDGAFVKKDDLLFVIEQDQYKQQVNLTQAIYTEAKVEYDRQIKLLKQNATSQAAVDQALSSMQQALANLKLAQINLGYTEVRAPFDGWIGRHLIDVGNYLPGGAGGTRLAVIQMVSPIYIYFALNESEVLQFLNMTAKEANRKQGVVTKPVFAKLQSDQTFVHQGVVDFAANQLNTTTGALQMRGQFQNTDVSLLPGLYATVLLQIGDKKEGLLVLNNAVLSDQQGSYVFVVNSDQKAVRQNIQLGQQYGPLVAVTSGLKETDQVVMDGFITLSPGVAVKTTAGTLPEPVMPVVSK